MNRREFMDLAGSEFLASKKGYGEVETAFKMAAKLGLKLTECGYLGGDPEDENYTKFIAIVKTSIRFMAADGGHWGDENMAIKKAVELSQFLDNPKAAKTAASGSSTGLAVDNPQNLPVYAPGGQLAISGVPQMPNFPAGPSMPTTGIMMDSAIQHGSNSPAQPAGG